MNIRVVFIGYRASGKTTLSAIVAGRLNLPRYATDALVEARTGRAIEEIVRSEGWAAFRRLEHEVIRGIDTAGELVVDCGGGVVEDGRNMTILAGGGARILWLDASIEVLIERLQHSPTRPLLSEPGLEQDVYRNYSRRSLLYQRFAHHRIDTGVLDVEEAAQRCLEFVQG